MPDIPESTHDKDSRYRSVLDVTIPGRNGYVTPDGV